MEPEAVRASPRVFAVPFSPDTTAVLCSPGRTSAPYAILCAGDREMEPRIAQDTADFRELREKGYIYVDKTE